MPHGKLTSLTITGLRTIASLTLPLNGLVVLVGENGAGKSSIVEALELCRRLGADNFLATFNSTHGGVTSLLRHGASGFVLAVEADLTLPGEEPLLARYQLGLEPRASGFAFREDFAIAQGAGGRWNAVFERQGADGTLWTGLTRTRLTRLTKDDLLLPELSGALAPHPAIRQVRELLAAIEVHLPFEVTPSWAARAHQRPSAARGAVLLQPAERLEMFGTNLANAYFTLRNEHGREHWEATMDLVRLGLGGHIESVNTRADPGGGSVALTLKLAGRDALLPVYALSDGQLAYLCFVAMVRLNPGRSLLAFDEPELHMHPELLVRLVQFFEEMAQTHPVIVATHSDVLLDALSDPAASVRVCELDNGETRLRQLDEPALRTWLERYRGVGQLRSEGHLGALLRDAPAAAAPEAAE